MRMCRKRWPVPAALYLQPSYGHWCIFFIRPVPSFAATSIVSGRMSRSTFFCGTGCWTGTSVGEASPMPAICRIMPAASLIS